MKNTKQQRQNPNSSKLTNRFQNLFFFSFLKELLFPEELEFNPVDADGRAIPELHSRHLGFFEANRSHHLGFLEADRSRVLRLAEFLADFMCQTGLAGAAAVSSPWILV